ncbi:hypothetical protein BGZ76_000090, partial [Entomortierella beljakovae]
QQEQQQRLNLVVDQKLLKGQNIDKSQLSLVSISAAAPVSVNKLNANTNKIPTTIVVGYTTHDDTGVKSTKTNNYHLVETSERFDQLNSEDEEDEREYQEYKRARKLKKQLKKDLKEQKTKEKLELKAIKRALKEEMKNSDNRKGSELSRRESKSRGRRQSQGEIQYVKKSGISRFFKRKTSIPPKPKSGDSQETHFELNGKPSSDIQERDDSQYQAKHEQRKTEQGMDTNQQKQGDDDCSQIELSASSSSQLHVVSSPDFILNTISQNERREMTEEGVEGDGVAICSNEGENIYTKTNTKNGYWSRVWSKVRRSPAQSRSKT